MTFRLRLNPWTVIDGYTSELNLPMLRRLACGNISGELHL